MNKINKNIKNKIVVKFRKLNNKRNEYKEKIVMYRKKN